jgi:DNA replication and repair protein RecF
MYRNISDYLGNINIVLFSPDDLDLVKGSPSVRRKFLDQNIGQINKNYLNALIKYRKLLKERNELLKTENVIIDIDLLDVITKALIDEAKIIIKEREAFIHNINKDIKEFSMTLSNNKEWVQMVYNPHTNVDNLWKTSEDRKSYDIFSKTTTWGPTRDDIKILVNEEEASIYCSQGQIRTACIATKLALARLYKGYNDKIIVILDDVLSELDNYRQEQVLKLIDSDIQTFITTTSLDNIDEYVLKDSNILEIKRGNKK